MKFTTPIGRMGWGAIHVADEKYDNYVVSIFLDKEDPQFLSFKAQIEEYEQAYRQRARVSDDIPTNWPWKESVDKDSKQPDGEVFLTCKMKAATYKRKGGAPIPQRPTVLDENAKPWPGECPKVGPGSTVRAAGEVGLFANQDKMFVSLKMVAFQVLDLVEKGAGFQPPVKFDVADYDFGAEGVTAGASADPFKE